MAENLQDHLNFGPSVEVRSDIETIDAGRNPATMAEWQEQYLKDHTGPLAEGAAYSYAFWPLQLFNTSSEEAELKHLLNTHGMPPHGTSQYKHEDFIRRMILSPDEASATVFMSRMQRYTTPGNEAEGNYMTILAMLSHPFSRGSVHIKSAKPSDHPRIDCAYLSHPLDAEILSRHCLQIDRLLEQPTYNNIVRPGGQRLPRGYGKPFESLDEAKSAIRTHGATNYHPCGTCAMTAFADEGVVDGSLRVYDTSNLRVCDASVFPIIPRGNILTTVYAVAEKAAEKILGEYHVGTPNGVVQGKSNVASIAA